MEIHEKFLNVKFYMSHKMGWNVYMCAESENTETFTVVYDNGKFKTFYPNSLCYLDNDELNEEFEKFAGPIQLGLL